MATTTQAERTEQDWNRYFLAMAAAGEVQAQAWDADGAAAAVEPYRAEAERAANVEHYRGLAASARKTAAQYRTLATDHACVCGGLGRIGDSLCRCQSAELLGALGCEVKGPGRAA
jgi:hypothetical protein